MTQEILLAFISILPQLVLIAFLAAVGLRFRKPIARLLDERVSSVSAFGVSISLRPAEVDEAVLEKARPATSGLEAVAPASGAQIVDRATRLAPRLAGRAVLWVDDHPENNRVERRMLRQMGVFSESVRSNREAMSSLDDPADRYDVVISDIGRDDGGPDGLSLLQDLGRRGAPPVIFYVGFAQPDLGIPPGAFGIADRPDRLLNLVMDALDRGT